MKNNLFDKLETYSIELILGTWSVFLGFNFILSGDFSPSVDRLDYLISAIFGVLFIVSGSLKIIGSLWFGKTLDIGWVFLRMGMVLAATAWLCYGVVVIDAYPDSLISFGNAFIFAAINITLYIKTMLKELKVRRLHDTQ